MIYRNLGYILSTGEVGCRWGPRTCYFGFQSRIPIYRFGSPYIGPRIYRNLGYILSTGERGSDWAPKPFIFGSEIEFQSFGIPIYDKRSQDLPEPWIYSFYRGGRGSIGSQDLLFWVPKSNSNINFWCPVFDKSIPDLPEPWMYYFYMGGRLGPKTCYFGGSIPIYRIGDPLR